MLQDQGSSGRGFHSLEVFKDRALSNLVCWKLSLPMAGSLEVDNL